ncbi:hypothetical protein TWF506_009317 [Arthrobotrys conoides]|uniref:Uncharacterized protein n=1 Tax=Arthrobotrys conoides TaxID=74498 RepID=A0AAN8NMD3_9PEZI
MCLEETDQFLKCGHGSAVVVTICNIYASMVEADPTGYFTSEDRLPIKFCPAWRSIRTKYSRYCEHCESQIQERFRKQKEEERRKRKQNRDNGDGSDGAGETSSNAGSVDSWQLVVQAPSEADVPVASTSESGQKR